MTQATRGRTRVAIVGGGFGGLYAARALRRAAVEVCLIDRQNYHCFQPLLYQVATGALSPGDIASPIRLILRNQRNVRVVLGAALAVHRERREVELAGGDRIAYDELIVATGATHHYYGHDEWAPFAPGLKTLDDALDIRRRILLAFEAAEREEDEARREELLTFVVVGGGPTGVELAGAVSEIARRVLARAFRRIDPARSRVILLEGGPRILPAFPESLSRSARRSLERLCVEVRTGTPLERVEAGRLRAGGREIRARTVIWAAGVAGTALARSLGTPLDGAGRVPVSPSLALPGDERVWVIGDLARFEQDGRPLPGVAQVAIQQGRHAARNIARRTRGEPPLPFRYRDPGSMATIGRSAAVADLRGVRLTGAAGWLAWVALHIAFLIGFRNRLIVLVQWAWAYLVWQRGAMLITGWPPRGGARDAA